MDSLANQDVARRHWREPSCAWSPAQPGASCFNQVMGKKPSTWHDSAGPHCDGQILVLHDLLGLTQDFTPKFVKRYANLDAEIKKAVGNYIDEVRSGLFPDKEHSYHTEKKPLKKVEGSLGNH